MARRLTLGARVRKLRLEEGYTLSALSERTSISVSYLNDIEHDRTVPSLARLQQIAQALGLDARGLLEGVHPFGTQTSRTR